MAAVEPGYSLGRDMFGLTNRERQVLQGVLNVVTDAEIGRSIGVSKQRVGQIKRALVTKGALEIEQGTYLVKIRVPQPSTVTEDG